MPLAASLSWWEMVGDGVSTGVEGAALLLFWWRSLSSRASDALEVTDLFVVVEDSDGDGGGRGTSSWIGGRDERPP